MAQQHIDSAGKQICCDARITCTTKQSVSVISTGLTVPKGESV